MRMGRADEREDKFFTKAAERMAEFIHDRKVDAVVVTGASAQSTAYMVKQFWKAKYPSERMPGFVAVGKVAKSGLGFWHAPYTQNVGDRELEEIIFERGKKHLADKNKRIFLMEDAVKLGRSIGRMQRIFREAGYRNVLAGAITASPPALKSIRLDFVGEPADRTPHYYSMRRNTADNIFGYRHHRRQLARLQKGPPQRRHSAHRILAEEMKKCASESMKELRDFRARARKAARPR